MLQCSNSFNAKEKKVELKLPAAGENFQYF